MTLDKDTVFLVTGAAGSIVSAITADLAAASGGTFYLLDLVPEPDPGNPDLSASSPTKKASSAICSRASRRAASGPRRRWSRRSWPALERAQAARERHRRGARGRRHARIITASTSRMPTPWRR